MAAVPGLLEVGVNSRPVGALKSDDIMIGPPTVKVSLDVLNERVVSEVKPLEPSLSCTTPEPPDAAVDADVEEKAVYQAVPL